MSVSPQGEGNFRQPLAAAEGNFCFPSQGSYPPGAIVEVYFCLPSLPPRVISVPSSRPRVFLVNLIWAREIGSYVLPRVEIFMAGWVCPSVAALIP